ncbi:MAG: hypothetical protein HFH32_14125 [Eubacterium sp.]|jgi:hypothetical protein|nr:hypothetical protein [Eubacterium sp.]
MSSTPYDDVFRTMLNDCPKLVLAVVNEAFGEHYTGEEKIIFAQNEHFMNRQDGQEEERITDSCFTVCGERKKQYHIECQSTADSSMLVRIFEYASQISLDCAAVEENVLEVSFPHSAVLFLRHAKTTPDTMKIRICTPGGSQEYRIPVIKLQKYGLKEIFEKNLLFFIPFYLFVHEKQFGEYEKDVHKLEQLKAEYAAVRRRLEELCEKHEITEYMKCMLTDMINKVASSLAEGHGRIVEGVREIMGGKVLDYEAKRIKMEGIEEGISQGITQGISQGITQGISQGITQGITQGVQQTLASLVRDGILTAEQAAERMGRSMGEMKKLL